MTKNILGVGNSEKWIRIKVDYGNPTECLCARVSTHKRT